MEYRAILNFDYKKLTTEGRNKLNELRSALGQIGWTHLGQGSSAFSIQTDDLDVVCRALDLLFRQNERIAELRALTFQVQAADSFDKHALEVPEHKRALEYINARPLPWED